MVRCVLYDAAGHDREIDDVDIDLDQLGDDQLLWLDGAADQLKALPDLPAPMREALARPAPLQAVEVHEHDYRFCLTYPAHRGEAETETIRFIAGSNWLLTLCDARPDFMERFVADDRGETLKGRMSASALVVALLLDHLSDYRADIVGIDKAIDKLDETILRSREHRAPLKTLAVLRRRISILRLTISDIGTVVQALNRPDFLAHIDEADAGHFRQLRYTFDRLEDTVGRVRETIVSSFDLYDTRVSQDTNQLIKALTIVTVVTGIVSALAGIFGMNFDIPLEHSGLHGFVLVTSGMVISSLMLLGLAAWRRWL